MRAAMQTLCDDELKSAKAVVSNFERDLNDMHLAATNLPSPTLELANIVNLDDYEIGEPICHRYRWLRTHTTTRQKVCIKKWTNHADGRRNYARSWLVSAQLNLPGVAKLIGFNSPSPEADEGFDVCEYAEPASLHEMLDDRRQRKLASCVTGTTFSIIVFGVAATMSRIHSLRIVHRDLKPSTVLLNEKYEPLLTGFVWSRFCAPSVSETVGTTLFMAPGLFTSSDRLSLAAGVFAFGTLLHEIFSPHANLGGKFASVQESGRRLAPPANTPDAFWDLFMGCWKHVPEKRP
jgi:serine/threonine protein kinase